MLRSRFAPLAAAALLLAPAARAADPFQQALPEETLLFIGVDDVSEFKELLTGSETGSFWMSPEMKPLRDHLVARFTEEAAGIEAKSGANPLELIEMISGPVGLALLDVADPELSDMEGGDLPLAFAVLLGTGDRGTEFLDKVHALFDRAVESGDVVRASEEAGDVEVFALLPAEGSPPEAPQIRYGLVGDAFVLVLASEALEERAYFEEIVDRLGGEGESTLVDAPEFSRSLAAHQDARFRLFADVREVASRLLELARQGAVGPDEAAMLDSLGLDQIGPASANFREFGDDVRSDFALRWSGEGHIARVVQAFAGRGDFRTFSLVPATALSASGLHLRLAQGIDTLLEVAAEIQPDMADLFRMQYEMMMQPEEGVDLRADLIGNLSGEIGWFTGRVKDEMAALPGTESDPANVAVLLFLKDGARAETALDALIRSQGMHVTRKKEEFQGQTVWSMDFFFVPGGKLRYAILPDLLVISPSAELVQDVLRRRGASDLPSLAADEEFQATLERLGGGPYTSMTYADAAAQVKGQLEMLRQLVQTGELDELGLSIRGLETANVEIPGPEVVDKYVKGSSIQVQTLGRDGLTVTGIGP